MKLLLLADSNSAHTIKWVRSLSERGINILLFGLNKTKVDSYSNLNNVQVITLDFNVRGDTNIFSKFKYILAYRKLKKLTEHFEPDIVHAHFASSYGFLGALLGRKPLIVSVWGSDVYWFPKRIFILKLVFKWILSKADIVLSTSEVMACETRKYCTKNVIVTPFGIDLNVFKNEEVESLFNPDVCVIGTIKTLDYQYGIEYLIRAFKIVVQRLPNLKMKLLIIGEGPYEDRLKQLAVDLNVQSDVIFYGSVPYSQVPKFHNMIDIFVALSINDCESFGVSIIEAGACERPAVVSAVGGLEEVVVDGETGLIVPPMDAESAAKALIKLIENSKIKNMLGKNARERVSRLYNWQDNVTQMVDIYKQLLDKKCVE